jgi:antitoxin component YwqK of YwqJK toxin-antitoxin module
METHTEFYGDGQKMVEYYLLDGLREGNIVVWHRNGRTACKGNYVRGVIEGRFTQWHDNGQKSCECNYIHGLREGEEVWRDKDGGIQKISFYINDHRICLFEN